MTKFCTQTSCWYPFFIPNFGRLSSGSFTAIPRDYISNRKTRKTRYELFLRGFYGLSGHLGGSYLFLFLSSPLPLLITLHLPLSIEKNSRDFKKVFSKYYSILRKKREGSSCFLEFPLPPFHPSSEREKFGYLWMPSKVAPLVHCRSTSSPEYLSQTPRPPPSQVLKRTCLCFSLCVCKFA